MKKNILVVDDSALMRRVFCDIINSDDQFQVVDMCGDGLQAYEKLRAGRYDAVVLDVYMPRLGGLQLLERLQEEKIKATVIVVSTSTVEGASEAVRAIELGAVDFLKKPENLIEAKGSEFRKQLLGILGGVFGSPLRRSSLRMTQTKPPKPDRQLQPGTRFSGSAAGREKLVVLACSTGGPKALHSVVPKLSAGLNAPMVIVQHMPEGFTGSLAARLNELSAVRVKEAEDGEILQKGVVYIAPGGRHLELVSRADGTTAVHLSMAPAIGGLRPCANITYRSLDNSRYEEILCVVLTGMGADGTEGISYLAQKRPVHVVAQDAESCVVYGMPRAIAETGLVDEVVSLELVANTIMKNVGVK